MKRKKPGSHIERSGRRAMHTISHEYSVSPSIHSDIYKLIKSSQIIGKYKTNTIDIAINADITCRGIIERTNSPIKSELEYTSELYLRVSNFNFIEDTLNPYIITGKNTWSRISPPASNSINLRRTIQELVTNNYLSPLMAEKKERHTQSVIYDRLKIEADKEIEIEEKLSKFYYILNYYILSYQKQPILPSLLFNYYILSYQKQPILPSLFNKKYMKLEIEEELQQKSSFENNEINKVNEIKIFILDKIKDILKSLNKLENYNIKKLFTYFIYKIIEILVYIKLYIYVMEKNKDADSEKVLLSIISKIIDQKFTNDLRVIINILFNEINPLGSDIERTLWYLLSAVSAALTNLYKEIKKIIAMNTQSVDIIYNIYKANSYTYKKIAEDFDIKSSFKIIYLNYIKTNIILDN